MALLTHLKPSPGQRIGRRLLPRLIDVPLEYRASCIIVLYYNCITVAVLYL